VPVGTRALAPQAAEDSPAPTAAAAAAAGTGHAAPQGARTLLQPGVLTDLPVGQHHVQMSLPAEPEGHWHHPYGAALPPGATIIVLPAHSIGGAGDAAQRSAQSVYADTDAWQASAGLHLCSRWHYHWHSLTRRATIKHPRPCMLLCPCHGPALVRTLYQQLTAFTCVCQCHTPPSCLVSQQLTVANQHAPSVLHACRQQHSRA